MIPIIIAHSPRFSLDSSGPNPAISAAQDLLLGRFPRKESQEANTFVTSVDESILDYCEEGRRLVNEFLYNVADNG